MKKEITYLNNNNNIIAITLEDSNGYLSLTGDIIEHGTISFEDIDESMRDKLISMDSEMLVDELENYSVSEYIKEFALQDYVESLMDCRVDEDKQEVSYYDFSALGQIVRDHEMMAVSADKKDLVKRLCDIWEQSHLKSEASSEELISILDKLDCGEDKYDLAYNLLNN